MPICPQMQCLIDILDKKTNTQSILESSRKSSIIVMPARIAAQILGMATTVLLARNLTVEEYGIFNLFLGSILVFSFLTNLGLAGSLQRFLSEYARLEKFGIFFRTFFFSMSYRMISGVVVFMFATLFFDSFSGYFKVSGYKFEFAIFCLGTYALFQIDYLVIAFNALFLHVYSSLGQMTYVSLRCALIAIIFLALGGGLYEVFVSELIAYGFGAVLFWGLFIRKVKSPMKEKANKDRTGIERKRFLRFSAYNAATIPGNILFSNAMDYFVVAVMASTNQLGIYALGSRASQMLLSIMPQNIMQSVIRPAFYHRYYSVEEKNAELNRMFRSMVVIIAACLFPVLALVGIQAEHILTFFFKSKFSESSPIFVLLLLFNVFTILELPGDLVLQAIEKVQARFYAQIFAVYNLVAAVLLMPQYGVLGVAFATGSALMGKCLFFYVMAHHYTGITVCWNALLRIGVNTIIATIATYWVGCLGDSSPAWMFASLVAGAVVYVGMCLVNNFLNDDEKELVNRFCKRRVFNV